MKKQIYLFILVMCLSFNLVSANWFWNDDPYYSYDTNLNKAQLYEDGKVADIELLYNTNYCLEDCYAIYKITPYKDLTTDTKDYGYSYIDTSGFDAVNKLNEIRIYEQVLENYEQPVYLSNCLIEKSKNGTNINKCYEILDKPIIKQKESWKEIKIEELNKIGESKIIKIVAKKDRKDSIDWRPIFAGQTIKEMAWWSSYSSSITISNFSSANIVVKNINGTAGVNIGGETAFVYGMPSTSQVSLYYTDANSTAVGTDTSQLYSIQTLPKQSSSGTKPANLQAAFFFDNNISGIVLDSTGTANATLTAGAYYQNTNTATVGRSLNSTNVNGMAFTNPLVGATSITLMARFYFSDLTSDPMIWSTTSFAQYCQETGNKMYCDMGGEAHTNFTISANKWYSFVWTKNTTDNCMYLVNSTEPTTIMKSCQGGGSATAIAGANMYIGNPGGANKMYGNFDELQVWESTPTVNAITDWLVNRSQVSSTTSTPGNLYETESTTFSVNSTGYTSATLRFNNTNYPASISGNNASARFTAPFVSISTTMNWFWMFNGGTTNSTTYTKTVNPLVFGICNSSNTIQYLNVSFKDETTTNYINASVLSSTFNYYMGDGDLNKTLTFSNSTENPSYLFCADIGNRSLKVNPSIEYRATNYPQRNYAPGLQTFSNTTTNKILYLLSSTDGIYTTFITVTQANTPIIGADISISRNIGGTTELIGVGITDGAGSYTIFVNPNYEHTITASKIGYGTNTQTVRPTQSTYTLVLAQSSNYSYVSDFDGLNWGTFPVIGIINNQTYRFGFNVSSQNANIVACEFDLIDYNKATITSATTTALNSSICSVFVSYNPANNGYSAVKGRLLVNLGDGFKILEDDPGWIWATVNSTGMTLMDWMRSFNATSLSPTYFNNDESHRSYTYTIILFLIIMIICAILNQAGFEFSSPGGLLIVVNILIIIFSYGGFLDVTGTATFLGINSPFPFINKYFIAFLSTIHSIGYLARSNT